MLSFLKPVLEMFTVRPHVSDYFSPTYTRFPNFLLAPLHIFRLILLRILLQYKGWMNNPRSTVNKLYLGLVRFLCTTPYASYDSIQWTLPKLPVPPLKQTLDAFHYSVLPLLNDEEQKDLRKRMDDFENGEGKTLQLMLQGMAWDPRSDSWLHEMWLRLAYLQNRKALPLASSFYGTDFRPQFETDHYTNNQAERAASLIATMIGVHKHTSNKDMPPFLSSGVIPLCMASFKHVYGTNRRPGVKEDVLEYSDTQHIAVLHKGQVYTFDVYHSDGDILTVQEIREQIEDILCDGNENSYEGEISGLSQLSCLPRDRWAAIRDEMCHKSSLNKASFEKLESSLLVVCLDENDAPKDMSGFVNAIMHNEGRNRWFDKSVNVVIFKDGRHGSSFEHSFADGTVMGQWCELNVLQESFYYPKHRQIIKERAISAGAEPPKPLPTLPPLEAITAKEQQRVTSPIARLKFEDVADVKNNTEIALAEMKVQLQDVNMSVGFLRNFGNAGIKKARFSPDAFMQLSIQIAYYRMFERFSLTYESISTRTFKLGRTETNRSLSVESKEFVLAFCNQKDDSEGPAIMKLLSNASRAHGNRIKMGSSGQGVDRHILGLRVMNSVKNTHSDLFEHKAFHFPWLLSTTTVPLILSHGNSFALGNEKETYATSGGGFCQHEDDGLGISYFFYHDVISIHLNSRKGPNLIPVPQEACDKFYLEVEKATNDLMTFLKAHNKK